MAEIKKVKVNDKDLEFKYKDYYTKKLNSYNKKLKKNAELEAKYKKSLIDFNAETSRLDKEIQAAKDTITNKQEEKRAEKDRAKKAKIDEDIKKTAALQKAKEKEKKEDENWTKNFPTAKEKADGISKCEKNIKKFNDKKVSKFGKSSEEVSDLQKQYNISKYNQNHAENMRSIFSGLAAFSIFALPLLPIFAGIAIHYRNSKASWAKKNADANTKLEQEKLQKEQDLKDKMLYENESMKAYDRYKDLAEARKAMEAEAKGTAAKSEEPTFKM